MDISRIMNYHVERDLRALPADPNYFILKKRNKFTKCLMRMLKKLNVLDSRVEYDEVLIPSKVEVDLTKIGDFITNEMYYFSTKGVKIERILLGRSQYDYFTKGDLTDKILNIPYNNMTRDYMGARVQLNPYIDGVVFVPREQW